MASQLSSLQFPNSQDRHLLLTPSNEHTQACVQRAGRFFSGPLIPSAAAGAEEGAPRGRPPPLTARPRAGTGPKPKGLPLPLTLEDQRAEPQQGCWRHSYRGGKTGSREGGFVTGGRQLNVGSLNVGRGVSRWLGTVAEWPLSPRPSPAALHVVGNP